jgi:sortase (surface protein transpeptidase)
VQLWNRIRPAANSMLFNFHIELVAKKLAYKSKRNNSRKADNYQNTSMFKARDFIESKHIGILDIPIIQTYLLG